MSGHSWLKLIAALFLPQLVGAVGGMITSGAVPGWYADLAKPGFNPPNSVFGPVWGMLYLMMGFASFLVWQKKGSAPALWVYAGHLLVNLLWTVLFFGLHSPFWALVDIMVLWGMIVLLIVMFARFNRIAAWLLVPYGAWVGFAAVLNYFFWRMN